MPHKCCSNVCENAQDTTQMYTDTPGKITITMEEKLKKKMGGNHHKLTKIITFKEKLFQVFIWNSRCKQNPDFKVSIKAPNKLKIPQKTPISIWTSFRDALQKWKKKKKSAFEKDSWKHV